MSIPTSPTGLTVQVYKNEVDISWIANPDSEKVQGYNVYNSTTSGGGVSGYVKLNNALIEMATQVMTVTDSTTSSTTKVISSIENETTTVTVADAVQQDVFTYAHINLTTDVDQFYVITAVNDLGEESPYSIEIEATPIIISTNLVSPPIRSQNDVSLDYITTLLQNQPTLDVKPGTLTRQLHVDPVSYEFYLAYVRIDFAMKSQSLITLRELDDPNNTGTSQPVSESPYKQLLEQAFFFTNNTNPDQDTQNMIDTAFDQLAGNLGTFRLSATKAQTTLIFYTEVAPSVDITVDQGITISTIPTEIEPAITFTTLSSGTMTVTNVSRFYNTITQRYELPIPAKAIDAGSAGNVNSETLINSNVAGLKVTNVSAAFGGQDEESNSHLADRALLAIIGLDVGTFYGYKRTVAAIPNVLDEIIIDAGNSLMMRDYDEVRKKHVFGKVDIYIEGSQTTQYQETFGFLFELIENDASFTTYNPYSSSDWIIRCNNTEVNPDTDPLRVSIAPYPLVSAKKIKNTSTHPPLGSDYDLTGDWQLYLNGNPLKYISGGNLINNVRVDLATGDIIFQEPLTAGDQVTADYYYKISITNELPTYFSPTQYILQYSPTIQSYTVSKVKNNVATVLTESSLIYIADYTLDRLSRTITLTNSLDVGETLSVSYEYVATQITGEVVITSAVDGQTTATLVNSNILESYIVLVPPLFFGSEIYIDHNYNTINAAVGMDLPYTPSDHGDYFLVNFRLKRVEEPYLLLHQPVDSVISLTGEVAGTLSSTQYYLNKFDDILLTGNSTEAIRTVEILPIGSTINGDSIFYNAEHIVLLNAQSTQLAKKGIAIETMILRDSISEVTYQQNIDYYIIPEGKGLNVQIGRTTTTTIPNDGRILDVFYEYGELFTIVYTANSLVETVQNIIDTSRHLEADVLVKEALETPVDFELGIIVKQNSDLSTISSDVKTAISNAVNKLTLGQGVSQSEIISSIEDVNNVVTVVVPLTKMVKADGAQINREQLFLQFTPYSSSTVVAYTTGANALQYKTLGSNTNNGFYGIFENDRPLIMIANAADIDTAAGQGIILSTGEIIISTLNGLDPGQNVYTVDYVVKGESGSYDITVTSLEYLTINSIVTNLVSQSSS